MTRKLAFRSSQRPPLSVGIQVLVRDFVANTTDDKNDVVTPIRFVDEKKGSFYRCLPIRTSTEGKTSCHTM
jgi:hypothetical protein